jgi:hypothetical protein
MLRVGLSLYLALAVVAAPLGCCCQTARLVAALLGPGQEHAAGKPACCCQDGARHDQRPCDERKDGNSPTCPCGEQGCSFAALMASGSEGTDLFKLSHAVPSFTDLTLLHGAESSHQLRQAPGLARESVASHFLTPDELLRTLHILRC